MFFSDYFLFTVIAVLACGIIGGIAGAKVHGTYRAYSEVYTRSNMTGYATARTLLHAHDVYDVSVGSVKGNLTDHYDPRKGIVNLSSAVYGNNSVAAVAVAAHEVGHVLQKKEGYFPYKLRAWLVPVTNIGSKLAIPLVILGLIIDLIVGGTQKSYSDVGYYIAIGGVCLYGLATLFSLVTLPVEFDASRRAKKMLIEEGILSEDELPFASKMLSAAAMTYVASLLTTFVYFLRFLIWVLILFGGRRRND